VRLLDAELLLHESPPLFDPDPADPALLPVNCAADVVLHYQDLHESSGIIGPWDTFAALALHESSRLFDPYPADTAPFCH
jgi:hypothetical protein